MMKRGQSKKKNGYLTAIMVHEMHGRMYLITVR